MEDGLEWTVTRDFKVPQTGSGYFLSSSNDDKGYGSFRGLIPSDCGDGPGTEI